MKNKNTITVVGIGVLILVVAIFMFAGSGNAKLNGNAINSNGEVQIIKLSVQGSNYVLSPSQVKVGVPVRIEADIPNMPGCSKSIVISSFNIRKTVTTTDNIIEFTPDKAGTFNIACSMNMYRGTFTVLQNDGSKSTYVQPASASGGSCGGSGGRCGCGGGA
jgi:plastocyanin domain-containing protein